MKKIALITLLLYSIALQAQFSLSVGSGVLFSDISSKSAGVANKKSFLPAIGIKYSWNRVSLNTGIAYINVGYNSATVASLSNCYYKYLVVPVYGSYAIPVGRFYIGANAGANLSTLLKARDANRQRIDDAYSVVPSLLTGVKAGYNISRRFSFDISGWYNYALSDFDRNIDARMNSFAVLAGMNYKF
ncbi:MAG: hypothetical protein P4L28_04010 [Paludibacteraceae bacterium]|nr:hypothetical protein [Paludibacteraceae bacterium]